MEAPVLSLKDVSAGYPGKPVLHDVSADIHKGEFVGLIGSNGAGKSTLLKAVSGLIPLTSGTITIDGVNDAALSPKERAQKIAVVPQSFNIDYDFTVRDIVMMGRNPYLGATERESENDRRIVEDAMRRTDTLKFADRLFNTLSGGERQKVIIARAIAQDTGIILLDEPTSALDLHHQIEVMELIEALNKEGVTVLAVLHDLNLAARYCDRLIMIEDGKVIADGAPKAVITEDNLNKIYDMKMLIRDNPLFDKPEVTPVRVLKTPQTGTGRHVHVIGGADTATGVLEALHDRGYTVTAGVLPENSGDNKTVQSLGIKSVTAPPFSAVTPELQRENLELMRDADAVYIADIPFGEMNILNLDGLENVPGKLYIDRRALASDYTGGRLKAALDAIKAKKKLTLVDGPDAFLSELTKKPAQ